jgi:hypothetical protein
MSQLARKTLSLLQRTLLNDLGTLKLLNIGLDAVGDFRSWISWSPMEGVASEKTM